jgi:hypothetical protein
MRINLNLENVLLTQICNACYWSRCSAVSFTAKRYPAPNNAEN